MSTYEKPTGRFLCQTAGEIDYVKNGSQYKGQVTSGILVGSQSDLALLESYTPGSIAFTAGYAKMWMLGVDGTWTEIIS